jgi:transposase
MVNSHIDARARLTGTFFVLETGIFWEYLPRELGCGTEMSCWRRLHIDFLLK